MANMANENTVSQRTVHTNTLAPVKSTVRV
jgi:hypothetical protein